MKFDVKSIDSAQWPEVAKRFADFHFEHSYEYAVARAREAGASPRFLGVYANGHLVGATSVRLKRVPLTRRSLAYISGGPLTRLRQGNGSGGDAASVLDALKHDLVHRNGHYLFIRFPPALAARTEWQEPLTDTDFTPTQLARGYETIVVDLTPDENRLQSNLAAKWRSDLRFAQRAGLSIEWGTGREFWSRFLRLYDTMQTAKGFDGADPLFFCKLPPDSIGLQIGIASKGGEDIGGHVLSLLGDTALYLFGATNELGRATKAGYLLNWHSMLLAKKMGFTQYDLGGIDQGANPGGYRFKSRMGGRVVFCALYEVRPAGVAPRLISLLLRLRHFITTK